MVSIRRFQETDWPAVWSLLRTTFQAGDTYAFSPESPEAEIHKAWVEVPAATYVACTAEGQVVGTYFIKPNQPGLGSHVCNCGYVVASEAQGQGIASALCEHSQAEAVSMGFRAMQFNFVVATNERAVRLWKRLGFGVVGTLPRAFRHQRLGFVDALVMYKELQPVTHDVELRDVSPDDLPILFEQQFDPEANKMAAFPARDRDAFMAHWMKILCDPTLLTKAIWFNGRLAGNVVAFRQSGEMEVGYWLGREYWGQGIATRALAALLRYVTERPLFAHVAKHNIGSIRVLEKCGFTVYREQRGSVHGEEAEEFVMILEAGGGFPPRED